MNFANLHSSGHQRSPVVQLAGVKLLHVLCFAEEARGAVLAAGAVPAALAALDAYGDHNVEVAPKVKLEDLSM